MELPKMQLDYAEAVANWFAILGKECAERGELEEALQFTRIAGYILAGQSRTLSNDQIETNMLYVAKRLPGGDITKRIKSPDEMCLHVMCEALSAGGLTAMAARWMLNDRSGRRHSVALLSQTAAAPQDLISIVSVRGGSVYTADPHSSLVGRAIWLRKLAYAHASHVVLHADVSDMICGAAFGVPGGPPVMLVNHAAHIYWTCASVVDLMLNCRGGKLEDIWASVHRGISRYATLPIPLPDADASCLSDSGVARRRGEVRQRLGLSADSIVLLSAGASFKYLPIEGMDFVATCEVLLHELPEGVLLVAGFHGDERWQEASRRVGSRIRTLGRLSQTEMADLHAASDIYLEAFPFGTTTSLLESALRGLPVVLAPATCPPPYGSDGLAIDDVLERPTTTEDYISTIVRLARSLEDRQREGRSIQRSVLMHHTGDGWRQHLVDAMRAVPEEHRIYPLAPIAPTPRAIHEHWQKVMPLAWNVSVEEALENAVSRALYLGLKPRVDDAVRQACRSARRIRSGRSIPLPLLTVLLNYVFRLVPNSVSIKLFRVVTFLFQGCLLTRLRNRLSCLLRQREPSPMPYQEYR